jgi:plastocyanin
MNSRGRFALLSTALLAMAVFGFVGADHSASAQDGDLTVRAGDGETGYTVNAFLPQNLTVVEGTTVTWQFPWREIHMVAFPGNLDPNGPEPAVTPSGGDYPSAAGYAYSGVIAGDPANPPTYALKFVEAGTYDFFCFIHPKMSGKVTVLEPDAPNANTADTQASVDTRGEAEYGPRLAAIKTAANQLAAKGATVTTTAAGKQRHELTVGLTSEPGDDAVLFLPGSVTVHEGDTVAWVSSTETPHNVVFGPPAEGDPFEFPGDPSGSSFSGTGRLQSPMMFGGSPTSTFEVAFPKAGTYEYICMLHADQGMVGTVIVTAAPSPTPTPTPTTPAAPAAPNTGSGSTGDGGVGGWTLIGGAIALAIAAGAAGMVAARR